MIKILIVGFLIGTWYGIFTSELAGSLICITSAILAYYAEAYPIKQRHTRKHAPSQPNTLQLLDEQCCESSSLNSDPRFPTQK
jgi:hypothetical protein